MIDEIDLEIIKILKKNSRIKWVELGEQVHMSGQAVGNRIKSMEEKGIIAYFTIALDESQLNLQTAYVTFFMKNTDHVGLQKLLKASQEVAEAHRISGDGCYLFKVITQPNQLLLFLDSLLDFGNYRVNISIQKVV